MGFPFSRSDGRGLATPGSRKLLGDVGDLGLVDEVPVKTGPNKVTHTRLTLACCLDRYIIRPKWKPPAEEKERERERPREKERGREGRKEGRKERKKERKKERHKERKRGSKVGN